MSLVRNYHQLLQNPSTPQRISIFQHIFLGRAETLLFWFSFSTQFPVQQESNHERVRYVNNHKPRTYWNYIAQVKAGCVCKRLFLSCFSLFPCPQVAKEMYSFTILLSFFKVVSNDTKLLDFFYIY